jgi:hypothetical protein
VAVPQASAARPSRQSRQQHARATTLRDLREIQDFRELAELWVAEMPSSATPSPARRTTSDVDLAESDVRGHVRPMGLTRSMRRMLGTRQRATDQKGEPLFDAASGAEIWDWRGQHIRWTPEMVDDGNGNFVAMRDDTGRVFRGRGEWERPAREAVKRLPRTQGRRWLVMTLNGGAPVKRIAQEQKIPAATIRWRRNHPEGEAPAQTCEAEPDLVTHLAAIERTTPEIFARAVAGCARRAMQILRASGQLVAHTG